MPGIFQDDKGKRSSGRLQTTASVLVGLGLAITMGAGEWRGKAFSENLYILTGALTIGGAGMKGLQKFSERDEQLASNGLPTKVAVPQTVAVPSTEVVSSTSKIIKVQTPEKELTAVLQEGW
ncbi:hypothetical protein [Acaryochloris sp. IP29b_bin.148]|uniref:hypothetical protein n=1 Tax=Acaryochloris sp. IP29b_bin.148 TaxID=2969218 RepID=UPI002619DE06|nr:hypothetical protein [Acaryochloris sp. IP29b_bin.148]